MGINRLPPPRPAAGGPHSSEKGAKGMRAHRPSGDTGGVPGPEGIPVRLIAGVLVCVMAAACGAAGRKGK